MRINGVDFNLVTNVIDQLPYMHIIGLYLKEKLRDQQIECRQYDHAPCIDKPEIRKWRWPN